jgi:hypothetical protein
MKTTKRFINITFDNKLAPNYFIYEYHRARKIIGVRYDSFIVQFTSLLQASKAIESYKAYLTKLGHDIQVKSNCYAESLYADIGNHSAWNVLKLEELKNKYFYSDYLK